MGSPTKRIPIHVWGGLGSQLFAVALSLDLKERFPYLHFLLKLHTGGVTSRSSEIDLLFPELEKLQIMDFSAGSQKTSQPSRGFRTIKPRIMNILALVAGGLGFVNRCNTSQEFARLKPWVLTIRGHYAYRPITSQTLLVLWDRLTSPIATPGLDSEESENSLAIHYRLGDLLTLAGKDPIDVSRIGMEIQRLVEAHNPSRILCFSDSPKVAAELLQSYTLGKPLESKDLPALSVIREACKSRYFVGSNSKISFWIVCLRIFRLPTIQNSLPRGSKINWIHCSDRELQYASVAEY